MRGLLILLSVIVLSVGLAAGGDCQKLNFNAKGYVFCDPVPGFDYCDSTILVGSPNGLYTLYYSDSDFYDIGDDTLAVTAEGQIETENGILFLEERDIVHLDSLPAGWGFQAFVSGGEGKYEGVTGWIAGFWYFRGGFRGGFGTGQGELCWPEE